MKSIDRFQVIDLLGSGTQGKVYRCKDPKLQREVAIKVLHSQLLKKGPGDSELLHEAQAMSQVHHQNVVSVFDAGEYQGHPYVVFERIEGRDLSDIIKRDPPNLSAALNILQGVLEGMAQAHAQDIVHRDLKPSNIILTRSGLPKITDFGIAAMLRSQPAKAEQLVGTPRYMAPEYIRQGRVMKQTDVFALGLIAYELLTGQPAYAGNNVHNILHDIINKPVKPLDQTLPDIDQRLQKIIERAVEKDPFLRFADAREMLDALLDFVNANSGTEPTANSHSTVQFLLRRIRLKSDFPALAQSISTLNQLSVSEIQDTSQLANIIVKDYGLTNKILKVVNSAYYAAFSGTIGTISRAIVILGVNGVRSIAASLALLEHFGRQPGMGHLRDILSESLYSALCAREISQQIDHTLGEEALLGTMLRRLGNILVAYYLPDEEREIRRLLANGEMEGHMAELHVLGTTYEHVGRVVAKEWNFPVEIRQCIRNLKEVPGKPTHDKNTRLQLLANLSDEATQVLRGPKSKAAKKKLQSMLDNYASALGLESQSLVQSIGNAKSQYMEFKVNFADNKAKKAFLDSIEHASPTPSETMSIETLVADSPQEVSLSISESGQIQTHVNGGLDREQLLSEGLQEVTRMLVSQHKTRELLNLVLEILYRGMRFSRVVAGIMNAKTKKVIGVTGLGHQAEELAADFQLRIGGSPNLLSLALIQNSDVYIKDATQQKIVAKLPDWLLQHGNPGSFFALPLRVEKTTLGIIYAEYDLPHGFDENPNVLHLVQALRNQLILGLHQGTGEATSAHKQETRISTSG